MNDKGAPWLIAAGVLSIAASLLHIACVIGGGPWYRFLGAGEQMARMAEAGMVYPTIVTLGIAAVLAGWAFFAFSGAGLLARLPLLRTCLVAITAVLLMRAVVFFVPSFWLPEHEPAFILWSSVIVFVFGLVFAIGTFRAWPHLKRF